MKVFELASADEMRQCLLSCSVCHKSSAETSNDMLKCAGCGQRRYCSAACQAADWKAGHKAQCKKIQSDLKDGGDLKKKGNKKKGGKK